MAQNINQDDFDQQVLKEKGKVLVDFWAPWCGPCQMLGPIIDDLATELKGKVKVVKVNVDENKELAEKYNVSSIPNVTIFEDGKTIKTLIGVQTKQDYLEAVS
jgi:thioredoxin 1